jgi:hypothetical protein
MGKTALEENRVKIGYLGPDVALMLLNAALGPQLEAGALLFRVPALSPLPTDAEVCQIAYDPPRRAFCVLISSMTYDPVEPGRIAPDVEEGLLGWQTVKFVQDAADATTFRREAGGAATQQPDGSWRERPRQL